MASRKHDFSGTEIKAGIFVIVSILVLAGFAAVIRGMRPPEDTTHYKAYFSDTGGLNRGADVRYGGVKVGRVERIAPSAADQSQIEVDFSVRRDTPVNEASSAYITQTTLTSEKHLEISTGKQDAALMAPDSTIPTRPGGLFGEMAAVSDGLQGLMGDIRDLLGVQKAKEKGEGKFASVAEVLTDVDGTVVKSQDTIEELHDLINSRRDDVTAILAKVQDVLDSSVKLTDQLNEVIGENRENLRGTVSGSRKTADEAAELVETLSDRLDEIAATLQTALDNTSGLTGEARDMVETNRGSLEDMLMDLRETVRYLKQFAYTLSEQPDAVLRGKSPEGRR